MPSESFEVDAEFLFVGRTFGEYCHFFDLFPLHSLDCTRSGLVGQVVSALRDRGLAVEERPVPYEFQPGSTAMLVIESS